VKLITPISDAIPAMIGEHLVCLKRKRNGAKWHADQALRVNETVPVPPCSV